MAPPEKRRGDPRQGRPSIAAFNNGNPRNSISADAMPALAEVITEALASGTLLAGGRFELRSGRLWREGAR